MFLSAFVEEKMKCTGKVAGELIEISSFYILSIVRVASGYVAGVKTPTSKDYSEASNAIVIWEDYLRKSQRFVAKIGFYDTAALRQDSVLLEVGKDVGDVECKQRLWVVRVFGFFRVKSSGSRGVSDGVFTGYGNEGVSELEGSGGRSGESEVAFFQYFEVIPRCDAVDEALGCVKLRWARNEGICNKVRSGKCFDVVPMASFRGVVHTIPVVGM